MTELALGAAGVLVGWVHGGWSCWAHLESHRALAPTWSRSLGSGLAARPVVRVGWHRGLPVALHADRDGSELVVGAPGEGSRVALPGRDPIAFVSDGDDLVVATTSSEGLGVCRVRPGTEPDTWLPVLARRDLHAASLHRFFNGFVLVAGLEQALAVITLDPQLRVLETVTHQLSAPLESLHGADAGNRLALALRLRGKGSVDAALLDAAGSLRERPHPVLRGPYQSPRVYWDTHGFRIAARNPEGTLFSRRLDGEAQPLMEDVGAPFAIGHDYGHTVAASVVGHELALRVRDLEHMVRPATVDLTPSDAPMLAFMEQAREVGQQWTRLRMRGGYRGANVSMQWDPAHLEAAFPAEGGAPEGGVRFRFELRAGRPRLVVTFGEPGEAAPAATWARLMGWLRNRFSDEAREAEARARSLVAPIVGDELPEDARLEALGEAVLLELPMDELPTPEILDGWLRAILSPAD